MTRAVPIAGRGALLATFLLIACGVSAQDPHQWTERENMGFRGPVRSVLTTVHKLNPDPRPADKRKLSIVQNADWAVFDVQGRRTEFASAADADRILATTKCTYAVDGAQNCINDQGQQDQSLRKETVLPDGSHEITYYYGAKLQSREIVLYDTESREVGHRNYDNEGKLTSEDSTQFEAGGETDAARIYDQRGAIVSHTKTRISADDGRFERWEYAADGHVVWYLQLDENGELISSWYEVGYKPTVTSSGSLGICRPKLCVDYRFDEQGSGRFEKTVQHTPGQGNIETDSEEHYGFDGLLDEKIELKYVRDTHGNWTERSVFVWDFRTNQMVETEEDTRKIEYY